MSSPGPPGPWASHPDAATFPRRLRAAFDEAARRAGRLAERAYRVADLPLRVRLASDALVPLLTPALAHLERQDAGDPALTISVWDSRSTGVPMPPPPWGHDAYLPLGQVRGTDTGAVRMAWEADASVFSLLDLTAGTAICRAADPERTRTPEAGTPFRMLLGWWLDARGYQVVHAGAVGTPAGAALLAGAGGSGKTTTALACLRAGLGYLADDYCLLQLDPEPRVWSLYATAKVAPDGLRRFPELTGAVIVPAAPGNPKAAVALADGWGDRLVTTAPIRAIVLPAVSARLQSRLRPVSRAEALRALAPSTMFQLAGDTRRAFARVSAVVGRVPAFALELGQDLGAVPALVAGCLEAVDRVAVR